MFTLDSLQTISKSVSIPNVFTNAIICEMIALIDELVLRITFMLAVAIIHKMELLILHPELTFTFTFVIIHYV